MKRVFPQTSPAAFHRPAREELRAVIVLSFGERD